MSEQITSSKQYLGDVEVDISYDYTAAEERTIDSPGCAEQVTILMVDIDGRGVWPGDFSKWKILEWESDILEEIHEARRRIQDRED